MSSSFSEALTEGAIPGTEFSESVDGVGTGIIVIRRSRRCQSVKLTGEFGDHLQSKLNVFDRGFYFLDLSLGGSRPASMRMEGVHTLLLTQRT